jgi:TPR repeat protein
LYRYICCTSGHGVKKDLNKAKEYLLKGVDKNDPGAQSGLEIYYNILHYEEDKNYKKDMKWYLKANENNYSDAENGYMYKCGTGVERDYVTAMSWYKESVENGSNYVYSNVGDCTIMAMTSL